MKKLLLLLCFIVSITNCKNNTNKEEFSEDDLRCTCPPCVHLVPLDDFSGKEVNALKKQMESHLPDLFYPGEILTIDSTIHLDSSYYNKTKTRYRAEKILNKFMNKDLLFPASDHNIYIALTNKDISTSYKGKEDWGVLGLSYKGKYVAVASTYRVKNAKRDFWKVVTHEFVHSYFNIGHCLENNDSCIMKDAKGYPDFNLKKDFCKLCKENFRI